MPDPNPSQDTLTLTCTWANQNAPHVLVYTRNAGESDDDMSARALKHAGTYGAANAFGKIQSITPVWST